MAPAIVLFAKAPIPGLVKTRLQPTWTAEHAARLYRAFVDDMLDTLQAFDGVELQTDISTDAWTRPGVSRSLQVTGDLGRRMLGTLDHALRAGACPAMILGSDVPSLPASFIRELLSLDADVALGPSEDGGYYAISCRRTHPAMFEGVEWSGPHALKGTLEAARRCGLSVALGPTWFDIDSADDLARLIRSDSVPRHTAAALDALT